MKKRRFVVFINSITVVFMVSLAGNLFPLSSCLAKELPKVNWRCQSCVTPPETIYDGQAVTSYGLAALLARNVKEKTNGNFNISMFTPGAILNPMDTTQGLITGVVEMGVLVGNTYTGIIPEGDFSAGLPFGPANSEDFLKVMTEGNYMKIMQHAYAKHGLYYLMRVTMGASAYITKFPVYGASDFKGRKLRASGIAAEVLNRFGAISANIAVSEIYTALQRGTIDGCHFAVYSAITYKVFEVAKYVHKPYLNNTGVEVVVNMKALNQLPEEYRNILIDEGNKLNMWTLETNSPKLDRITQSIAEREYKVTFTTIPADEWARMRDIATPSWEKFSQKTEDCAKLVEVFKKYSR